jgi:hypothetical protein
MLERQIESLYYEQMLMSGGSKDVKVEAIEKQTILHQNKYHPP